MWSSISQRLVFFEGANNNEKQTGCINRFCVSRATLNEETGIKFSEKHLHLIIRTHGCENSNVTIPAKEAST